MRGKFISVLGNRCPRCLKGRFWEKGNPYSNMLLNKGLMRERCSNCNLKYEIESGFWYGGMIMSYVFNVLFLIVGVIISEIFFEELGIWEEALGISVFLVLLIPITFYLSRLTWINFFVSVELGKEEKTV